MATADGRARTQSGTSRKDAARTHVESSLIAFRRILRALRIASQETQRIAGISAAQLFVLQTLDGGSEFSLSEIATNTMTDRSSVAAVVDRLVSAGLASRSPSAHDKRRAAITITRAGRAVLRHAPKSPTALLVDGLATLPGREQARIAESLSMLASAMGLSRRPATMLFEDEKKPPQRRQPGPRTAARSRTPN